MKMYRSWQLAWMVLGCFAALAAPVVHAAPNIGNDFEADIAVTRIDLKPRGVAQKFTWSEWFAGKLGRFDVIDETDAVAEQLFRYLPGNALTTCNGMPISIPESGKNGKEYAYLLAKDKCRKKGIPVNDHFTRRPVPRFDAVGFFDFASSATNAGACTSRVGNNSGTLWTKQLPASRKHKFTEIQVCVASNNSTPYWVALRGPSRFCSPPPHPKPLPVCEIVGVVFATFTPGVPATSQFCPSPTAAAACRIP